MDPHTIKTEKMWKKVKIFINKYSFLEPGYNVSKVLFNKILMLRAI